MPDDHRTKYPREFIAGRENESIRELAQTATALLKGQSNNHFTVTIVAGTTTTTRAVEFSRRGVCPFIAMTSAEVAAAIADGLLWVETRGGEFIVHHDAGTEDRELCVALIG